ncbi:hypothetical protein ScPMuIL_008153 [Solemya velum]
MRTDLALVMLILGHFIKSEPVISTSSGKLRGVAKNTTNGTVLQFLGVRYAEPPVGQRRFQKPEPFLHQNTVFNATEYGPSCIQNILENDKPLLPNIETSEDCLTLNVFVPRTLKPRESRSIMIWIHGGGFVMGQGSMFDGSEISLRGDVIVITTNYRLGLLGFLRTEDGALPGNYGLWDQRLAIQWVKDNAAAFGGNPTSITIFGESAGGNSVFLQSVSLINGGLFQRAIAQSGYSLQRYIPTAASRKTETRVSELLNCTSQSDLLICLRSKQSQDILKAQGEVILSFDKTTNNPIFTMQVGPVIDGDFLTDSPENLFRESTFRFVDLLAGFNDGDGGGAYFDLMGLEAIYNFNLSRGIPTNVFCHPVAEALANQYFPDNSAAANAICDHYTALNDKTGQSKAVLEALRDVIFSVYTIGAVDKHGLSNTAGTYLYQFSHTPDWGLIQFRPSYLVGANHADDVAFVFGLRTFYPEPYASNITHEEDVLSHAIMDYFTNFAKNGNPNAKGLPFWPEYRPDDKSYMNINLTTTAGVNLLETSVEFWDTLREKTRNDAHSNAPMALLYLFCVAFSIGIGNAGIELR